jgi:hypothetical protein
MYVCHKWVITRLKDHPVTSRITEHGVLSGSDCIYAFRRLALIMNPYDLWVQEVTLLEVPSHLDILLYPYPHPHQERPWGHFLIEDGMAEREVHNSVSTVSFASPWTGFELTTLVVIGTDCIGSYKPNYHTITTTTASTFLTNSGYSSNWVK